VVIGTDYIGSYKSNYHTSTTTTALITKLIEYVDRIVNQENGEFMEDSFLLALVSVRAICV
jgi:hypothetical protein